MKIVPYGLYEPVCKDNRGNLENSFNLFCITNFTKIGLRLPLNNFEKQDLTYLVLHPSNYILTIGLLLGYFSYYVPISAWFLLPTCYYTFSSVGDIPANYGLLSIG